MEPYKKPFQNFSSFKNKSSTIQKAIDRKEAGIKKYTEDKSMSIAISSAFNMSAERCNALLSIGKLQDEDFWDAHEVYFEEYLARFLARQDEAKTPKTPPTTKKSQEQPKNLLD